jgi:SAM-dependent MidA family methyltransferase
VAKYGRARKSTDDNIIWLMRIACWIPKDTNTLIVCNGLLIALPLEQWLREHALLLHYTYFAFLVRLGAGCVVVIRRRGYVHTYIHTYIHTCLHAYINTYIDTHTCMHTYIQKYIIHTYVRRYMHACIRT